MKKTVATPAAVNEQIPGYLQDVQKFKGALYDEAMLELVGKPRSNSSKTDDEVANSRAKDECTRLTMGISSIVSWHLQNKVALPKFEEMLHYKDEQISKFCAHYHVSKNSDDGKTRHIYSDVCHAFNVYRRLMTV